MLVTLNHSLSHPQGHFEACLLLAEMLLTGKSVEKDEATAALWVQAAEKIMESEAQAIWVMCSLGFGHPRFLACNFEMRHFATYNR